MNILSTFKDDWNTNSNTRSVVYAAVGTGLAIGASYLAHRYIKNYLYWNKEFVHSGVVKELYIYPIKSCKGIKTDYLDCSAKGSRYGENKDRYFVLIDAKVDNMFLTARVYPKMVLIENNVTGPILSISTPDQKSISVNLDNVLKNRDIRRAKLFFDAKTDGFDCGDEVANFLTTFLGQQGSRDIRLLYFVDGLYTERDYPSEPTYWNNPVPKVQDQIGYHDLAAYLAFTTASVDELNSRLKKKDIQIDCRNFRPNILVSNISRPFDEDYWLEVHIGEAEFLCYKPCTRYRLAPEGKLKELYNISPIFGTNMAIKKPGRIRVGDAVFIRYKSTKF